MAHHLGGVFRKIKSLYDWLRECRARRRANRIARRTQYRPRPKLYRLVQIPISEMASFEVKGVIYGQPSFCAVRENGDIVVWPAINGRFDLWISQIEGPKEFLPTKGHKRPDAEE